MGWLKMLLERKLIVGFALVLLIGVSILFVDKLENQFYPEVNYDTATVTANADNMAALDVEENITNPIEEKISGLEGINSYESSSTDGVSSITVTFQEESGDEAYAQLQDAMSEIESDVSGIDEIETLRSTTAQEYEMFMDLHGGEINEMSSFTENTLKPRLESLNEVREVRIIGQNERSVMIDLDYNKLNQNGINVEDIENILQEQNSSVALGQAESDTNQPTLRWDTELSTVEEIENIIIPTGKGVVYLKNIADIRIEESRNSQELWRDGNSNYVWVSVARPNDVTQAEMTNAVRAEIDKIKNEGHIEGFELEETIVQSDFVADSIGDLQANVVYGGILVVIVLLVLLRNVAATAIIGISIPITVLLTFMLMAVFGLSINLISILALGIALGMIVDSSIVILESIYRKKEMGLDHRTATVQGTKEVFTPVLASTLTTMIVFLPIGLISGQVGEFAKVLSIVIVFSQITSVFISFTFIPVMSEKLLKVKKRKETAKPNKLFNKYNQYIDWMSQKTRRKVGVFFLFILIACSSFLLTFGIPVSLIPDFYNRQAEFYVGLEQNTTPEDRENVANAISDFLKETPDVEGYNVRKLDRNRMYVYVKMTSEDQATKTQDEINAMIHENLSNMAEDYPVTASGSVTYPIQVSIKGKDFDQIEEIGQDLSNEFRNIEGVQGITSTLDDSKEERIVSADRENLLRDELSPSDIKSELEMLSMNKEVGAVNTQEGVLPIHLSFGANIQDPSTLDEFTINTANGNAPLSEYTVVENEKTPYEIKHQNGERSVQILGDIKGRDMGAVSGEIQKVVDEYELQPGYTIDVGGEVEQQQNNSNEMYLVLLIALLLVFAIMSIQFNSLIHPVVVMFVIPLTLTGVLIGLFVTQTELNLLSAMGMLILIGIVVNNGILLIDRIKQLRLLNHPRYEAIKTACKERIRPILITFITTVFGAIPLALTTGHSGQYQKPMAIALIFGLSFSVFVTMLFVPVVYVLFEDLTNKFKKLFSKKDKSLSEDETTTFE
ncbi:efflux RND transporter permease subunit [Metabacillus arenae]|uniref:Efflux RND transporter permease subunit n=1 Tax=Metabacillus arenae TaxID=2771434 RepID=A0A926RW26_9BACI|nr:efflux RND transporter permease subunit [Metabacillus arenae]MBD1379501.1 efflux RND transporter permease subunit [Metabacillus arenae]